MNQQYTNPESEKVFSNIGSDFINHLEYGKIYVFASDKLRGSSYLNVLQFAVCNRRRFPLLSQMTPQTVELPRANELGLVLAARRMNAGNIGRYAVLACVIRDLRNLHDALMQFEERLKDVSPDDDSAFTVFFPDMDVSTVRVGNQEARMFFDAEDAFDEPANKKYKHVSYCLDAEHSGPGIFLFGDDSRAENKPKKKKRRNVMRSLLRHGRSSKDDAVPMSYSIALPEAELLNEEQEEKELYQLEQQRVHDLQLIQAMMMDYIRKYGSDPMVAIETKMNGKYIMNRNPLLVVNRNRKIVLPEYNEMELKMSAASRTLYIWFLMHPEGCRLTDMKTHRAELINIYEEVHPGCTDVQYCVDALLAPDKLNQNISRIKKIVRCVILNEDIASRYYIKGLRGGAYSIDVASSPDLVQLPQRSLPC